MFAHWDNYTELLTKMGAVRGNWKDARTFDQLNDRITLACPELLDPGQVGEYGFDVLCAALADEYPGDEDKVAEQVMLAASSRPGPEYDDRLVAEYGYARGDWEGYYVSERDDKLVYADAQYAPIDRWAPVEAAESEPGTGAGLKFDDSTGLWYDDVNWYLPDQTTVVVEHEDFADLFRDAVGNLYRDGKPADLTVQHYDRRSNRWRRQAADGVFEYYDETTAAWQRSGSDGGQDSRGPTSSAEPVAKSTGDPYLDLLAELYEQVPEARDLVPVEDILALAKLMLDETGAV